MGRVDWVSLCVCAKKKSQCFIFVSFRFGRSKSSQEGMVDCVRSKIWGIVVKVRIATDSFHVQRSLWSSYLTNQMASKSRQSLSGGRGESVRVKEKNEVTTIARASSINWGQESREPLLTIFLYYHRVLRFLIPRLNQFQYRHRDSKKETKFSIWQTLGSIYWEL